MQFKSINNISDLSKTIDGLDYETYHTSTNDKQGNKLIKFWDRKHCVMIVCVKGTKDFVNESQ